MKRILVVEDDKDIIELVRYNLEKDGYQVGATGDGATGLAQLRKTPPDLRFSTYASGYQASNLQRSSQRRELDGPRSGFLTAKGEGADRVVGLEVGADGAIRSLSTPRLAAQ
jgi:DNA-binding response OmpR family regulator